MRIACLVCKSNNRLRCVLSCMRQFVMFPSTREASLDSTTLPTQESFEEQHNTTWCRTYLIFWLEISVLWFLLCCGAGLHFHLLWWNLTGNTIFFNKLHNPKNTHIIIPFIYVIETDSGKHVTPAILHLTRLSDYINLTSCSAVMTGYYIKQLVDAGGGKTNPHQV